MKTRNHVISIAITVSLALTSACATSGNISQLPASFDEVSAQREANEHAQSERREARARLVQQVRERAAEADARMALERADEPSATMTAVPQMCDPRVCTPVGPRW